MTNLILGILFVVTSFKDLSKEIVLQLKTKKKTRKNAKHADLTINGYFKTK